MCRCAIGMLLLWAGATAAVPIPTLDPEPLPHEGQPVNDLRLEIACRFLPEQDGWGSPKLETTFTFFNHTDQPILLAGYALSYRLVLSRVTSLVPDESRQCRQPPYCGEGPFTAEHILRVPPHGRLSRVTTGWCDALSTELGIQEAGRIHDGAEDHIFEIRRPGKRLLAYMYRSDGPNNFSAELAAFLKPGERFWTGRVYSNAVVVDFTPLKQNQIMPADYTGEWVDRYPSGKIARRAEHRDGKRHGHSSSTSPTATRPTKSATPTAFATGRTSSTAAREARNTNAPSSTTRRTGQ
jgi:hypothetical protein